MKKLGIIISIAMLICTGCGRNQKAHNGNADKWLFTDVVRLKTTPVKDQSSSQLCWLYAMLATIETERIMMGDSINLSTDFFARSILTQQTRQYFLSNGKKPINLRGMATMLTPLIQQYGAEPFHSFHAKHKVNMNVLQRKLMRMADAQTSLAALDSAMQQLLDQEIAFMPRFIFLLGAEYTPMEFAHSICTPDDYVALTSFSHHPFGERFALEVPDNKHGDTFLNIPIHSLMALIDSALTNGHPVCWEGDISEPGFSFTKGIAVTEKTTPNTLQQQRQHLFETRRTTDDHCMTLVGIANDQQGNRFYIAKNSWGTNNPYGGFMYLSDDYIKLKTICIVIAKKAFNVNKIKG